MSIIDEDGNTVIKMSFLWKMGAVLLISLVSAQTCLLFTWGIWITSEVQQTKTDVAVIKSDLHGISSLVGKIPGRVATALRPQQNEE